MMRRLILALLSALLAFSPAVAQISQFPQAGGGASLSANNTWTANGALTSGAGPAAKWNGTWITGGSATTTVPMLLIEPSSTTSNAWSTSGTGLGVNSAAGFTGNLADFQIAATSRLQIRANGTLVSTNNIFTAASTCYSFGDPLTVNRTYICAGADKQIDLKDSSTSIVTTLSIPASNTLQFGALDAATAVAQTLRAQSVVAGTTNGAGANTTILGSLSTGSGASGDIIFQTGGTGAGSTAQNTATTALTIKGATQALVVAKQVNVAAMAFSATAPTISSGFGTSPSIVANNGSLAFQVNVGTGGTASSGVVGLPTAANGWACSANDVTTNSTSVFLTRQTASSTTTATFTNFNTAGAATAWVASDKLNIMCAAF